MITVRFFGLIRLENNIKQLTVKAGKVSEVLAEVKLWCPTISEEQLLQAVMFVNKKQVEGKKLLSMVLKDGDELVFLSPSSGG